MIIIGIWSEQNLLTYYNGDLSGRIKEIDVQWTKEELKKILEKGEQTLNIEFPQSIKQHFLNDANQNVGLLQRIAETYCFKYDILQRQKNKRILTDDGSLLASCRKAISEEESVRYHQFSDTVSRGFKNSESSTLKIYQRIVRVCVETSDQELCDGLNREVILERINKSEPKVRLSDLSTHLNRLNKLQEERKISPLIISYNRDSRKIQLIDRELLFYRKYGNPTWPWEKE